MHFRKIVAATTISACLALSMCACAGEILIGAGAQSNVSGSAEQSASPQGGEQGSTSGSSQAPASSQGAASMRNGQPESSDGNQEVSVGTNETSAQSGNEMTAKEIEEEESWSLILVNKTHPIPDGYEIPELTELANGNSVDSRVYPNLQKMFDDARAQGIYPHINSSYRTMEKQQSLMDEKINEYLSVGYGQEEAQKLAEEWVAMPGTSEHQLGLSLDISSGDDSGQDAGTVWWWLKEYCSDYGFILRYPEDKTQITGISNEPWHYRYVGIHAAKIITEQGLCLEEYLNEVN